MGGFIVVFRREQHPWWQELHSNTALYQGTHGRHARLLQAALPTRGPGLCWRGWRGRLPNSDPGVTGHHRQRHSEVTGPRSSGAGFTPCIRIRSKTLCKVRSPLLSPNSSQLQSNCQLGYSVGSSWIDPTRAKFSTLWPPRLTRAHFRQVVLLLLGNCAVVVGQLNSFLASWLGFSVPFGHPPMQVLIL